MRKLLQIFILILTSIPCFSQGELYEGIELFEEKKYNAAIPLFLRAYSKKPTYEAAAKVAACYWKLNILEQAEEWYEKASKMEEATAQLRIEFADVLKQMERYQEAQEQYRFFGDSIYDSSQVRVFVSYCDSFPIWLSEEPQRTVYKIEGVNTEFSEISPAWMNEELTFSSDRVSFMSPWKIENEETGTNYYEVYSAKVEGKKIDSIRSLKRAGNNPYHEGPATFSKDGQKGYITSVIYDKESNRELFTLDIFEIKLQDGKWVGKVPFEHNTPLYSEGHPNLSEDGERLYLVSNRPDGYGGTDIYVCYKKDTTWTLPLNLGPKVNSPFDEKFPFERSESELYYSSNRPTSMGGLDIYRSFKVDGFWELGENLKVPINSPRDDFGILFYPEKKNGFFTSSRVDGEGSDDLYGFSLLPPDSVEKVDSLLEEVELDSIIAEMPLRSLKIQNLRVDYSGFTDSSDLLRGQIVEVINDSLNNPVDNSEVLLINKTSGEQLNTKTDSDGNFQVKRDTNDLFAIQAGKDGYFTSGKNIRINDADSSIKIVGESDIIEKIQYDFDSYRLRKESIPILDRVVLLMKTKPEYAIVVRSYCDNRGDDQYNLRLSDQRALSVKNYLISQGIEKSRIFSIGFGEKNPLIENPKTEEEHFVNRRTEFDLQVRQK